MQTRRLGKTGLQVSEIGFGAEWLERHPEEEGVELIHYAADAGKQKYIGIRRFFTLRLNLFRSGYVL